jgi:Fe-S-cluster containining protein
MVKTEYNSIFLEEIKKKFPINSEDEYMNIFWMCLRDLCPKNCCSRYFRNGSAMGLFGIIERDAIPLLIEEKNKIAYTKGCESIIINSEDNMYYLKLEKEKDCSFLEKGSCGIEAIKPSLCRAFPMTSLDASMGVIFDYDCCPGFEIAEKIGRKMTKKEYVVMLESFSNLQRYRLDRLKLKERG